MTATAMSAKSQLSQNMTPSMPTMVSRSTRMLERRGRGEVLDGLDVVGDRAQEGAGLVGVVVGEREVLEMIVDAHAQIVRHPLADAFGVIVLDIAGDRA